MFVDNLIKKKYFQLALFWLSASVKLLFKRHYFNVTISMSLFQRHYFNVTTLTSLLWRRFHINYSDNIFPN